MIGIDVGEHQNVDQGFGARRQRAKQRLDRGDGLCPAAVDEKAVRRRRVADLDQQAISVLRRQHGDAKDVGHGSTGGPIAEYERHGAGTDVADQRAVDDIAME